MCGMIVYARTCSLKTSRGLTLRLVLRVVGSEHEDGGGLDEWRVACA